jgi:hypothetical protein
VIDVVELETERLKLRVAQSLSALQDDAYQRLQAQLATEQREYRAAIEEKDGRLRALELKTKGQRQRLEEAVLKMLNLAGKSGERYNILESARLARTVFRQWVRHLTLARRERRFERLPEVHFGRTLFRKVLGGWRSAARAERVARVDAYWRGQVEAARTNAAAEEREQVEALQLQLAQAREQIRISAEQRDALEDELKRAFMRGVCALNMEAVSILRHGAAGAYACQGRVPRRARGLARLAGARGHLRSAFGHA